MFIKLTNANSQFKGDAVLINTSIIVSAFRGNVSGEDTKETATLVFCPPHGTWEVEESVDEVYQLLNRTA